MRLRIYRREVSTIRELSQAWQALDADAWQARLRPLRARLMRDGLARQRGSKPAPQPTLPAGRYSSLAPSTISGWPR